MLSVATIASALTACGYAIGGETANDDPNAEAAAKLRDAQLVQFGEAKIVPERSEQGTYARLATIQQTEELRESADMDNPECMDAANRWGRLKKVREAPSSLATFLRGEDTIAHMLIATGEKTAQKVVDTPLPEECLEYEVRFEEGATTSYKMERLDIEEVADASRAYTVETEMEKEPVVLHSLLYRNGDNLGVTSILGTNEDGDYKKTLQAFTEAAVEREDRVFP
ncbi:hypothetical protein CDO52_01130 [Nocardiopsis gilva YIM 90087]|uniref:Uncharacterized protein n=1 Tax=Nocardiopsis gilva YIM 90087 TaxID=1235441 RepID=A0A223S0C6_9ACTN|nr:hypothetical protein [Nocardiopsis gilva]ASU81580.1 hypothetical protein CDO52_01130 [Nocardiopsis gilva YIM 90087]